mgnify:CR=1 FL=1
MLNIMLGEVIFGGVGAGMYDFLPLGLRVLRKVERIVREELDKSGALEIFGSTAGIDGMLARRSAAFAAATGGTMIGCLR